MKVYKFIYINYLSSNFGLFFIILCFLLLFFKILGLLIYILFISILAIVFFFKTKSLIINNETLIIKYKKNLKKIDFQEIESINVIHKDYYIYHIKAIELKLYNNKEYNINCNGIYEIDEEEEGMLNLYLFIKEKFENTFFIEYDLLKRNT